MFQDPLPSLHILWPESDFFNTNFRNIMDISKYGFGSEEFGLDPPPRVGQNYMNFSDHFRNKVMSLYDI